ncbi:class I SAM-dependent methyltransferase [Paucihalobacter sp.]|uniref:class I SAM-dependent methyltransferase n=1 Tax=Paucihalobacter sp. TaxID=2850405 RepID=UPI002FE2B88C
MTKQQSNWYASWFNTPYYHMLYHDRNHAEASAFMDNLTNYLNLPEQGSILDLACGKGRHSIYLNSLGYKVTGLDLSEESIAHAKQFETESLKFEVHDMSVPYKEQFDAVFNLFTSFGYFENEDDNAKTLSAIQQNFNETGFGVIDFMNVNQVINNLVPNDIKSINNVNFEISRSTEDGYIIKDIKFSDKGEDFSFTERVKAFTLKDFEVLFEELNISLFDVFGDYKLNRFYPNQSERLIMIFK